MMKPLTSTKGVKILCHTVAIFTLLIYPFKFLSAQQSSGFSVAGSPDAIISASAGNNTINLQYGDSLITSVAFAGVPDDGLGTDNDNVAYMSFSYTYSIYLTVLGDSFSTVSSIRVGSHTISAFQTCSSGIVPPWAIGYDAQPAIDANNLTMNISDGIKDCIPTGDYQVSIVIEQYSVNSIGPNPSPIQLVWSGYSYNTSTRSTRSISAPSTANSANVALNPISSYMFNRIASIHIAQPASCPNITLSLPSSIETSTGIASATAVANYPGQCPQNTLSYLWSNGERTQTATNLNEGNSYTVTVTSPCGNTASALVNISATTQHTSPIVSQAKIDLATIDMSTNERKSGTQKKASDNIINENGLANVQIALYPNPAILMITFDLSSIKTSTYSIRIMDITGKEVLQPIRNSIGDADNQKVKLSLDMLTAGIYLYEVSADKVYRGEFVKQ